MPEWHHLVLLCAMFPLLKNAKIFSIFHALVDILGFCAGLNFINMPVAQKARSEIVVHKHCGSSWPLHRVSMTSIGISLHLHHAYISVSLCVISLTTLM